jgi:hypothetical protein
MKSARLLGLLILSSRCLFCAGVDIGLSPMPERAAIPVAYVGQQRCKIVNYKGDDPIVVLEGAVKVLRKVPISVVPGGNFGPGFVTVEHGETINESVHTRDSTANGPTYASYTAFYAKLTADRDLPDAFLILLVYEYNPSSQYAEVPRVALLGSSIGRLEAGRKKAVTADFPPLNSRMNLRWVAMIFSGGSQIRTSDGNGVLDGLFDLTDHVGLERAMGRRAFGDFPLEVYRNFPLKFSDAQKKKYAGQTLNIAITVAPSGNFDFLTIDGNDDNELAKGLAGQFGHWLFLPAVKNGQAQSTSVVLPIKF